MPGSGTSLCTAKIPEVFQSLEQLGSCREQHGGIGSPDFWEAEIQSEVAGTR